MKSKLSFKEALLVSLLLAAHQQGLKTFTNSFIYPSLISIPFSLGESIKWVRFI